MIHAQLSMVPFGNTRVDVLLYPGEGISFTYVETLSICHVENFNSTFSIKDILETLYSSNTTEY